LKKLLLLCNRPPKGTNADTIIDHLNALGQLPGFEIFELSTIKSLPNRLDLDVFDVIVIHYTLQLGEPHDHFLSEYSRDKIAKSRALKVAFIQDEYREVNRVRGALRSMSVKLLFTLLTEEDCNTVYPKNELPDLTTIRVLAGYVPASLLQVTPKPIQHRSIDVSYRARKMPIWLGKLAEEKWTIAKDFLTHAKSIKTIHKLKIDISTSEADRLYAHQWIELLSNSKCVLGVESGSNVLDLTGSIRTAVEEAVNQHKLSESQIYHMLVKPFDGLLNMNQISPRHLECCALGTVQILFEGSYSGILVQDRHYIPLKKDFSNFDEVIKKIGDHLYLQSISDYARSEVGCNPQYGYNAMSEFVANAISRKLQLLQPTSLNENATPGPSAHSLRLSVLTSSNYMIPRAVAVLFNSMLKVNLIRGLLFSIWYRLTPKMQSRLRPALILLGR
jgi:hypothetical protein